MRCLQGAQTEAAQDSDSEGELFVPKSRKRRRDAEQPGSADLGDIDAEDSARFVHASEAVSFWTSPGAAETLRDRFVTGAAHYVSCCRQAAAGADPLLRMQPRAFA